MAAAFCLTFMMLVVSTASVKVLHIMVVIFMLPIQNHMKITGIQPIFLHPGYLNPEPIHRKAVQRILKHLFICSQIQKGRHSHIPADTGHTFQI